MTLYSYDGRSPEIDPTAWVAPGAQVIGSVVLGAEVSIWFGTTIRGDNEPIVVGEGTNLQEHVACHTDMGAPLTIGRFCTIGHKAMLHGCTIGEETLIGMGATILNHAVIGRNCLIGAGALITEGRTIPDRSLVVGAPGRIVRQLNEEAIAGLRHAANHYIARAAKFRQTLVEVG